MERLIKEREYAETWRSSMGGKELAKGRERETAWQM